MVSPHSTMALNTSRMEDFHCLTERWTLWAHLPHDTDWSIDSYKKIYTFGTVEEAIALTETLPDILVKNCIRGPKIPLITSLSPHSVIFS